METEEKVWESQAQSVPVWRDGLTTKMSYAIMAAHQKAEGYNCVCLRPLGGDDNKLKFYPDLATWSLTLPELEGMGFNNPLDRTDDDQTHYFRVYGSLKSIKTLLTRLATTRNVAAITEDMLPDILNGKGKNLKLHPPGVRIPLE
jgi:hypothetical protein